MVRDHSAAAPPVARMTRARRAEPSSSPTTRCVVEAERRGAAALADVDVGMRGDVGAELAQDPAAGRAPARVRDAAARVPALQPEREVAVAVGVEA